MAKRKTKKAKKRIKKKVSRKKVTTRTVTTRTTTTVSNPKDACYQATVHAGAWKIWPNPVWYPPEGEAEVRFKAEHYGGFHAPVKSLKGLAVSLDGKLYGVRTMHHPRESGYHMEGRVSVAGKKYSAFTSSHLFERPDGSLVDVAVFIIRADPKVKCLPAYEGWTVPTAEDVETWADDAAATGNSKKLHELASYKGHLAGVPHGDLARHALSHRAYAIEERLKGNIAAATHYEKLSEEYIEKYRKALKENPRSKKRKTSKKRSKISVRSLVAKAMK